MPIYEYQCPECANIFEEWAKASAMQEVMPCPLCHTPSEHIISHTAFVLKGGGWYVTDYGYRKNVSEDSSTAGSAAAVPPTHEVPATNTAAPEKNAAPPTPAPAAPSSDSSSATSPSSTANTASHGGTAAKAAS